MTATVQLNARIDRDLKEAGDAALSLIGFSPTQAVRALWEKAARRGKDLEEVAELLGSRAETDASSDADPIDPVRAGWAFMEEAYKSLGISMETQYDMPSDKELLEEARWERLVERGLV